MFILEELGLLALSSLESVGSFSTDCQLRFFTPCLRRLLRKVNSIRKPIPLVHGRLHALVGGLVLLPFIEERHEASVLLPLSPEVVSKCLSLVEAGVSSLDDLSCNLVDVVELLFKSLRIRVAVVVFKVLADHLEVVRELGRVWVFARVVVPSIGQDFNFHHLLLLWEVFRGLHPPLGRLLLDLNGAHCSVDVVRVVRRVQD